VKVAIHGGSLSRSLFIVRLVAFLTVTAFAMATWLPVRHIGVGRFVSDS